MFQYYIKLAISLLFFQQACGFNFDYACECGKINTLVSNRIVGGSETLPHELPWTVAIYNRKNLHCGGAIINNKYILTAGHCVRWSDPNKITILMGMHTRMPSDGQQVDISHTILHSGFFSHRLYDDNDIALIRLENPIVFTKYIQPVCLPKVYVEDYINQTGNVAGWGRIGVENEASNVLKQTNIKLLTLEECKKTSIGTYVGNTVICGYEQETDACQGDSGGPLVKPRRNGRMEQIGIVSWGIGCASPNIPGVYTKVSNYIKWIEGNTKDAIYCLNN